MAISCSLTLMKGVYEIQRLQIINSQVLPHGVRCEGLLRIFSWISFDLPQHQHLQPWVSVKLAEQKRRGQMDTQLQVIYQYEAYAGFYVIHLHTDGAPILLFSDPMVVVSLPVARTFCGRLLDQYLTTMGYFDPAQDWPKPIEANMAMAVVLEELAFLGDTRSRHELLVFAQANQSRLPLTMGIIQPNISVISIIEIASSH